MTKSQIKVLFQLQVACIMIRLEMDTVMMKQITQTATMMVETVARLVSIQIIVQSANATMKRLVLLDCIHWFKMVSVMMRLTMKPATLMVETVVHHALILITAQIVPVLVKFH